MKDRAWAPEEFLEEVARTLEHANSVVCTAAEADRAWAASIVWEAARRLAKAERRVLLVDFCLDAPAFTPVVPPPAEEGAVDAFFYGASLQRVATEQDVPGFFFLASGTHHAEPVELWAHSRWRRLARGFAAEGAVLMAFAPEAAVAHLALRPEGVVLLGDVSDEVAGMAFELGPETVIERVRRPPPPRPSPQRVLLTDPAQPLRRGRRHRRTPSNPWLWGVALITLAVIAVTVGLTRLTRREAAPDTAMVPPEDRTSRASAPTVPTAADSLYYAVQVAAFTTNAAALEAADHFRQAGWPVTITPVRLGTQGVWYRLMVGLAVDPTAAQALLEALWRAGLTERPNGTILRTPHAIAVDRVADSAAARRVLAGLRERGAVGYIVGAPDRTLRVLVGAFETAEQARLADSLLRADDLHGTVVLRTGIAQ